MIMVIRCAPAGNERSCDFGRVGVTQAGLGCTVVSAVFLSLYLC